VIYQGSDTDKNCPQVAVINIIMKKIFLMALVFGVLNVKAQSKVKADSAFYLLDTTKTLVSDRLWHTYSEGWIKFYELTVYSYCSPLLDKPTFAYSSKQQKMKPISDAEFNSIKKSSLSELLLHLKQFTEGDKETKAELKKIFYLYLIEPYPKGYTIVKTQLYGSGPQKITY
jgi:hypothetical protein